MFILLGCVNPTARSSVGHVISIKVVNGDNMPVWCFTIEIGLT